MSKNNDVAQLEAIAGSSTPEAVMTEAEMLARIKLLSNEMDANDEENREMQSEITSLYAKIDAPKH